MAALAWSRRPPSAEPMHVAHGWKIVKSQPVKEIHECRNGLKLVQEKQIELEGTEIHCL
jgi:hypothetical protein